MNKRGIRTCMKCGESKPLDQYAERADGRPKRYCAACEPERRPGQLRCNGCKAWLPEAQVADKGQCRPCYLAYREAERRAAGKPARVSLRLERAYKLEQRAIAKDCDHALRRFIRQYEVAAAVRGNQTFIARYWSNPARERERTREYQRRNPERKRAWNAKRNEIIRNTSDGSVNRRTIAAMKALVSHCPDCGKGMAPREKQADHIIALINGGHHVIGNIRIVCALCNGRKKAKAIRLERPG